MNTFSYPHWNGWPGNRPAVIAEIGMNHGGDENLAWKMIKSAHAHGADFVKIQSYITEEFFHPSLPYFSNTKSMELSFDAQKRLSEKAKKENIRLITTPYDFSSVDFFDSFNPPAHKIASMDNDNIPLIEYIAKKGRPVIISTGFATLEEIQKTLEIFERMGNEKIVLLHCVPEYPAKAQNLNLSMISFLREKFKIFTGFSDHYPGLNSMYISAAAGAAAIEKHFTTDRNLIAKIPDADHDISIEPAELKLITEFCGQIPVMFGKSPRMLSENELLGRQSMRRGLYAKKNIYSGEKLTLENTAFLRPVKGLKAGDWDSVCGKTINKNIPEDTAIFLSDICS